MLVLRQINKCFATFFLSFFTISLFELQIFYSFSYAGFMFSFIILFRFYNMLLDTVISAFFL